MRNIIVTTLLVVTLVGAGWGQPLPSAPTAPIQKSVEKDPYAWLCTTALTGAGVGAFTRPWIGFAAGTAVAVFGNGLQNSHAAHVDMLGGIAGAGIGYIAAKTMRHDWRHKK